MRRWWRRWADWWMGRAPEPDWHDNWHYRAYPEVYRPVRVEYDHSFLMSDSYALYNKHGGFLTYVMRQYNWVPGLSGWWCAFCHTRRCEHVQFTRERMGE